MERTPEEIKKGLECCIKACDCDNNCPYTPEINCTRVQRQDALACIRQLEAQVPTWISAEERLPEISDVVLVIASGKPRENIELHDAFLIASFWGDEGWIADGYEEWDAVNVTHWMPLPEPPKEGNT